MFFFFSSFNWKRHTIKSFLTACTPGPCVFPRVFSQMTLHSRYATRLKKHTVLRCHLSQKRLFSIPCSVLQLREMDFISVFQRLCLPKKIFFLMLIIHMRQRQIILNTCFCVSRCKCRYFIMNNTINMPFFIKKDKKNT